MSFKGFFSIFISGLHFVQRSGTIDPNVIEGHARNISVFFFFFKLVYLCRRRCHLKFVFYF